MIEKDNFKGQVAFVKDGVWHGRKLKESNFFPYSVCLEKAEELARAKTVDAHMSIFFSDTPLFEFGNYIGDFIIDIDNEDLETSLKDARDVALFLMYQKFPFHISFSSNKGFKFYIPWEAFNIEPTPVLPDIYREFAGYIAIVTEVESIDFKIYHYRHMNRIDNTIHPKTNLFQVPISVDELLTKDINYLREVAHTQRPIMPQEGEIPVKNFEEITQKVKKALIREEEKRKERLKMIKESLADFNQIDFRPCIMDMLKNGTTKGERNETALRIACELRNFGFIEEYTMTKLKEWNLINDPPLLEREIEAIVHSAYRHKYSFGCNDLLLKKHCPYQDRKECEHYNLFIKTSKQDDVIVVKDVQDIRKTLQN